jgi:hypothetical protein
MQTKRIHPFLTMFANSCNRFSELISDKTAQILQAQSNIKEEQVFTQNSVIRQCLFA